MDEESAKEFAEVGAADHDLWPSAVTEVAAGDGRRDGIFDVAVGGGRRGRWCSREGAR